MILTTDRLRLREVVESDWQTIFAYQRVGETPAAIG